MPSFDNGCACAYRQRPQLHHSLEGHAVTVSCSMNLNHVTSHAHMTCSSSEFQQEALLPSHPSILNTLHTRFLPLHVYFNNRIVYIKLSCAHFLFQPPCHPSITACLYTAVNLPHKFERVSALYHCWLAYISNLTGIQTHFICSHLLRAHARSKRGIDYVNINIALF